MRVIEYQPICRLIVYVLPSWYGTTSSAYIRTGKCDIIGVYTPRARKAVVLCSRG